MKSTYRILITVIVVALDAGDLALDHLVALDVIPGNDPSVSLSFYPALSAAGG